MASKYVCFRPILDWFSLRFPRLSTAVFGFYLRALYLDANGKVISSASMRQGLRIRT